MSLYEKLAKKGYLGTKAKVSAETGRADWSSHGEDSDHECDEECRKKDEERRKRMHREIT